MKKIFKKNQLIITAMAALIAVAGYLNFTEKNVEDRAKEASARQNTESTEEIQQSEDGGQSEDAQQSDDAQQSGNVQQPEDTQQSGEGQEGTANQTTEDTQAGSEDVASNNQDGEGTPGEAIFVNASGTVDFIVEAKMSKEYSRVTMEESLQEVISNTELSEDEKKAAVDRMVEITKISEREVAAENLIMAKGYTDVVVSMTDDYVDVIVVADEMDSVTRAQIEDIVKRKMGVEANKITINVVDTKE